MFLFQFPRFITNMALNINVKVHPVALFQIVDSYERRNADSYRVIGTLLGNVEKGTVEVTNCFCVPHREYDTEVIFMFLTLCCCIEMDSHASNERLANNGLINMAPQGDDSNNADSDSVIVIKPSGDENYNIQESFHVHIDPISLQVEAELVYAAELRDLNQRVNSQEVVVGWWATGNEVTRHSSLIHDYYTIECPNSIHLTLDTTLQGGNMGIKAYVRVPIGVPGGNNGNMFTSVPVEIACYEPEVVGLQLCSRTLGLSKRAVEPMQELAQVSDAARKLLGMLDIVLDYVSDVLASRSNTTPPDNTVGRALLDMVHSVPKMSHEEFENMLNSNIKIIAVVEKSATVRSFLITGSVDGDLFVTTNQNPAPAE